MFKPELTCVWIHYHLNLQSEGVEWVECPALVHLTLNLFTPIPAVQLSPAFTSSFHITSTNARKRAWPCISMSQWHSGGSYTFVQSWWTHQHLIQGRHGSQILVVPAILSSWPTRPCIFGALLGPTSCLFAPQDFIWPPKTSSSALYVCLGLDLRMIMTKTLMSSAMSCQLSMCFDMIKACHCPKGNAQA